MTDELWDTLSPDEAESVKSANRAGVLSPLMLALLNRDVVHVRDRRAVSPPSWAVLKKNGVRLRSRTDKNGGVYYWADPTDG